MIPIFLLRKGSFSFVPCLFILCLFFLPGLTKGQEIITGHNKAVIHPHDPESKEVMLGERLFYGLTRFETGKIANCESCHQATPSDSIRWAPSVSDLADWMKGRDPADLVTIFNNPASQLMEKDHKDMKITPDEAKNINSFLSLAGKTGMPPHKPFPLKLILFFVFGILMALALIDLIFTHYVRYRLVHVLVIIAGLSVHTQMAITEAQALSRTKDYAPDQPIKFSHKVHAGDNRIDCKYCHFNVFTSKSAGIPAMSVCMNCHTAVRYGRNSGQFEINKIYEAIKNEQSVPWVRIHKLPDHVYFNHAQHVMVAKVECKTCHGPVEKMDIVKQYSDLSMGFCVNCHRKTEVNFASNHYYDQYKQIHDDLKSGKIKKVTAETVGGLDCMRCHY